MILEADFYSKDRKKTGFKIKTKTTGNKGDTDIFLVCARNTNLKSIIQKSDASIA